MKKVPFKKIDAFATPTSDGNPAGMVYLDQTDLTAREMQEIARQLKGFVSEVGYVRPINDTTFNLKYYSSEREVEFCGHATIAIMYDLIETLPSLAHEPQVNIVTNKGLLVVENRIESQDAVFVSAPAPVFSSKRILAQPLAAALNIDTTDLDTDESIEIVNAGLETLIVPMASLYATLSIKPDLKTLKNYCIENGIDIITVFTPDVADPGNTYRTRVFAATFGYLEDPATGSGNAALGHYLLKHLKWDGSFISLEQNGDPDRPNIIQLMSSNSESGIKTVFFGGGAVVRIQGEYFLSH